MKELIREIETCIDSNADENIIKEKYATIVNTYLKGIDNDWHYPDNINMGYPHKKEIFNFIYLLLDKDDNIGYGLLGTWLFGLGDFIGINVDDLRRMWR